MEKWLNWAGKLADLEKKNEFELAEITQKTLCKPVGAFGFVVLHQVISKGIWYFLPQSIAVATINWESIPIKATISIPGISLRLSISGPLSITIAKPISITTIGWDSVAVKATISVPGISLGLGLSISRPLSVSVESTIAITSITKAKTVAVESTVSQPGIGLRLGLRIGGPLSVAVSKTAIAKTKTTVAVESTISQPRLSLSISGPLAISV